MWLADLWLGRQRRNTDKTNSPVLQVSEIHESNWDCSIDISDRGIEQYIVICLEQWASSLTENNTLTMAIKFMKHNFKYVIIPCMSFTASYILKISN